MACCCGEDQGFVKSFCAQDEEKEEDEEKVKSKFYINIFVPLNVLIYSDTIVSLLVTWTTYKYMYELICIW